MAPYIKDKRHLVGLIFVLIGLVLIIDNIRFIPHFIPGWIWSWQFLLIAIGGFSLLTSDKVAPGVILIGIGSVFLLSDILPDLWPDFFHLFADDTNLFWYMLLIIVGVSLILKNRGAHQSRPSKIIPEDRVLKGMVIPNKQPHLLIVVIMILLMKWPFLEEGKRSLLPIILEEGE